MLSDGWATSQASLGLRARFNCPEPREFAKELIVAGRSNFSQLISLTIYARHAQNVTPASDTRSRINHEAQRAAGWGTRGRWSSRDKGGP